MRYLIVREPFVEGKEEITKKDLLDVRAGMSVVIDTKYWTFYNVKENRWDVIPIV